MNVSPRVVRNFWLQGEIDGIQGPIATGPMNADGGFRLTIYQRDDSCVTEPVLISGRVNHAGELVLAVVDHDTGEVVFEHTTRR
jgi:hypothetical protein